MKRLFVIVLIFSALICNSQTIRPRNLPTYDNKRLHFGFTIGLNTMDFVLHHSEAFLAGNGDSGFEIDSVFSIEPGRNPGFHFGPVSNLRLNRYMDARFLIDIAFGQRDLTYIVAKNPTAVPVVYESHLMQIESIFVEAPLQIKFRSERLNNHRPYLLAGINPRIDMASQKKIKEEEMPKVRLVRTDLALEFGVGIDFYLPYFKFSTELKFSYGLRNSLVPDGSQYTSAIDKLNSQFFVLSFHFE